MLNNGDKNRMKILNIHAGTSDRDIIRFLEKKVIPQAKRLEEQEKKEAEKTKAKDKDFIYYEKKFWVFLDEINTCKSMGLISEMMCKHTYQGKPLPSNIAFIGACNPYRYDTKKIKEKVGLNAKNAKKQIKENIKDVKEKAKLTKSSRSGSLIYTVNPLPHSLLNFVFDFGNLTPKDEKDYITNIIKEVLDKYFKKYKGSEGLTDEDFKKIHNLAIDLIVASQDFIRNENDKSSVSLREIRRFNIFYGFFFNYLKQKQKEIKNNNSENKYLKMIMISIKN